MVARIILTGIIASVIIAIAVGTVYLVSEQMIDETAQILSDRTEFEIYQDFTDSQKRADTTMKQWIDVMLHSDDDLTNTVRILEDEKEIQDNLYNEYTSLPDSEKTDVQIRSEIVDIINYGWLSDESFIDSLKHQREAEREFKITLEHNGCAKTCPVYSVMINGDGTVLYKGLKNVKTIGKQEYEIPADTLIELNKFLLESSRENINEYGLPDDAKNTVIITFDFGQVKRIVNHDNSGPEYLRQFEEKIEDIAMIKQFVQTDEEFIISDILKESIRERVDNGTHSSIFVGIIDEDGTEQYHYGQTAKDGSPIDENTIFETGSISKVFTSLILADMVVREEVNLDDPIDKFLPEGIQTPLFNGKKITLLDLATHTSGLPVMPNYPPNPDLDKEYDYSKEGLYEYLSDYTISREIGSQYEYSNTGGSLLGHVLSLQADKSYEQTLNERVLDKLGMDSTCVNQCDELRERFAKPHALGELADETIFDDEMAGAGGVRSSGKDMLVFLSYAMDLEDSELQPSFELAQTANHEINEILSIGLGWHIIDNGERNIIWHNGATNGFASFVGFDSDSNEGVIVLTNSQVLVDEIGLDVLEFSVEE